MDFATLARLPFRYKPWKKEHLHIVISDLIGIARQPIRDDKEHLQVLIDWLCRAQDQRNGCVDAGSVSAGWSFEDGWLRGYPETSGYIIETFIAAAPVLSRSDLFDRAHRIIDWELSIQESSGAFPGHFGETGSQPVIFNTGQIVHGMLAGYLELAREECLESAVRAGYWMVSQQDDDGCWRRSVHNGIVHTYNTRAAWALLRTGLVAGESRLTAAAVKNLEWALSQQTACGWFQQNAFLTDQAPFTHNIAYAIRGLLESGLLLNNERFVDAASCAARALAEQQRDDGWLAGAFSQGWTTRSYYCCLTGLAQSGIIWKQLFARDSDPSWDRSARRAIEFLKRTHITRGNPHPGAGSIAGSAPIWGRYSMFEYPNWASKFFADLLLINGFGRVVPVVTAAAFAETPVADDVGAMAAK